MRTWVMGDPQASYEQVMHVLRDVAPGDPLISVGDHFDYPAADASEQGIRVLRYLADRANTTLLFGNHDAARVMELVGLSTEQFRAARDYEGDDFRARWPAIPTPGVAKKDFRSYTSEQRDLVIELLLANRFRLAIEVGLAGRRALVTHAGITTRELDMLGVGVDPRALAGALNARLAAAVDAVRARWQCGDLVPLSLAPLHVPGVAGEEGRGLLYHRPSWRDDPRRFHPSTLPRGLVQIAGHTGHGKCLEDLADWADPEAHDRRGIRTLSVDGEIRYRMGVHVGEGATLVMVDGSMHRFPDNYALLEVSP